MKYNNLTFGIIVVAVFVAALIGIYWQRDTSNPDIVHVRDFLSAPVK